MTFDKSNLLQLFAAAAGEAEAGPGKKQEEQEAPVPGGNAAEAPPLSPVQITPMVRFYRHMEELDRQAKALREVFPGFDLRKEMENPLFVRLTAPGVGLSVEDAYHAVHRREIQQLTMEAAARRTRELISQAIQSGTHRPQEAGTSPQAASVSHFDYRKATPEQRKAIKDEIRRAAAEGRKVYPG